MRTVQKNMLSLVLLLLFSMLTLPIASSLQTENNGDGKTVDDIVDRIVQKVDATVQAATQALLVICRLSYSFMVFLGTFLYMTSLNKRLGRDLVVGGIGLVLFFEILEPVLI